MSTTVPHSPYNAVPTPKRELNLTVSSKHVHVDMYGSSKVVYMGERVKAVCKAILAKFINTH